MSGLFFSFRGRDFSLSEESNLRQCDSMNFRFNGGAKPWLFVRGRAPTILVPSIAWASSNENVRAANKACSGRRGLPSAHALGLGDVRLKLTRPICDFER